MWVLIMPNISGNHPDGAFSSKFVHFGPFDIFLGSKDILQDPNRALYWGPLKYKMDKNGLVSSAMCISASWTIMWCFRPNLVS